MRWLSLRLLYVSSMDRYRVTWAISWMGLAMQMLLKYELEVSHSRSQYIASEEERERIALPPAPVSAITAPKESTLPASVATHFFAKKSRRLSSSHFTSSSLSPGPKYNVSMRQHLSHREVPRPTSSPMSPYRREHLQLAYAGPHVLHLDLGIFGRCQDR